MQAEPETDEVYAQMLLESTLSILGFAWDVGVCCSELGNLLR